MVFVSSDLEETLALCDRLVIMAYGRTAGIMENNGLTAEAVLARCYGEEEAG